MFHKIWEFYMFLMPKRQDFRLTVTLRYIYTFTFTFWSWFEYTTNVFLCFSSQYQFRFLSRTHLIITSRFPIFCLMWNFVFCSAFPTWLQGLSCPSLAPFNIAPTAAHHFGTFPDEKRGMKREHPALFSSFFTPWGVFVVHSVAELPPTLPTHRPCGLPSDLWSEGGTGNFKLFSSSKSCAAS